MGWTPLCRCYSSPPPPVISGFNLTSFDLFTYVMCNASGFLPSLCFPSCIHWMRSCCFIVVFTSCFSSLGHACLILCSLVMNFLQFAYSCLTFCWIITQIAFGVCFSWNIWIKITGLGIQENVGCDVVVPLVCSISLITSSLYCSLLRLLVLSPPAPCGGLLRSLFALGIEDFDGGKGKRRLKKTNSWNLSLNGKIYSIFGRAEMFMQVMMCAVMFDAI